MSKVAKPELSTAIAELYTVAKGTPLKFFSAKLMREVDLTKEGPATVEKLIAKGDNRFTAKKSSKKDKE